MFAKRNFIASSSTLTAYDRRVYSFNVASRTRARPLVWWFALDRTCEVWCGVDDIPDEGKERRRTSESGQLRDNCIRSYGLPGLAFHHHVKIFVVLAAATSPKWSLG